MAKKDDKSADDKIITEAKRRFKQCQDWESDSRRLFEDDLKFGNGDADNQYQWPDALRRSREIDRRPCLTINKTRQHCLQIVNDAKQNKPGVTVHPVSTEATYDAAQIYEGIIRHIEYASNAQQAYDTATEFQVFGGIGYWRVITDYANDQSFDQEIFIRRVKDPLSIYLDPDIKEADGSDAKFGFVFDDLKKEEFDAKYPAHKEVSETAALGEGDDWAGKDHVRVCEYYYVEMKTDTLVALPMPDGSTQLVRISGLDKDVAKVVRDDDTIQKRKIQNPSVKWCLIAGSKVIDRREWPGKFVPIVRVIGEETIIDKKLDRKGHVRALKDPQRMYNYGSSACVEFIALQGKQPYVAPVEAVQGFEGYWSTANTENHSYLPYNGLDEAGNQIAAPQRQMPPTAAPAYITMMQNASEEMRMVSGQYDATMGAPSNETSGVAINQRQRQGDRATYHYIDNLGRAVRFTGKILLDLIPKIYDTPRVIRVLGKDDSEKTIQLEPQAQQAAQEQHDAMTNEVQVAFNPNVGVYDVVADIGPAYQTRREEAFNALTQIASQNPQMMQVAGDLIMKAADFPMADELAERLERMVPANIKGDAPPPEVEQLTQQLQQMQQNMGTLVKQLADASSDRQSKEASLEVDKYKAETERMKVLGEAMDPQQIATLAADLVMQTMRTNLENAGVVPPPDPTQMMPPPQQPADAGFSLPAQ